MSSNSILFVTHERSQCGVYEFGENVFAAISQSKRYNFIKAECGSLADLRGQVSRSRPRAIIYNYMPATMPWVASYPLRGRLLWNNIARIPVPQIGILHSIMQDIGDAAVPGKLVRRAHPEVPNRLFDFYIAPDPTLLLKNSNVFKHGRPLLPYVNEFPVPQRITIGSFGFAKAGYDDLIELVQQEFDDAVIRLNIPFATYGDADGKSARDIAERCLALIRKPKVAVSISHDYLDRKGLLDFLAQNTINVFLRDKGGRGISSVLDNALTVNRPIAISESDMFRHLWDAEPSIVVGRRSLRDIIDAGIEPLRPFIAAWTPENLCWEYERILDSIFSRRPRPLPSAPVAKAIQSLVRVRQLGLRAFHKFGSEVAVSNWTGTANTHDEDHHRTQSANGTTYVPVKLGTLHCNRLLDDAARQLYAPAEQTIRSLVPHTFARKHPKANVQQAFVFDTVYRHLADYRAPKILCVGSFEDTACMALCKLGVAIEEIDPVYNYTVQELVSKPDTVKHSYDIIFSTSVIEHCADDESFIAAVSELLAPNGLFVMTCDYKDGWKPGDTKPGVCERLYTKADLERRLVAHMKNCQFIGDKPDWVTLGPDAFAEECNYSFASFCMRRSPA